MRIVKTPLWKVIRIGDKAYSFKPVEGATRVGIKPDGTICLRDVETIKVPKAVDAEGNVLEVREVPRTKLIEPLCDVCFAVRNGRLELVRKTEAGIETIAWWENGRWLKVDEEGNVVDASDIEFPLADGSGTMRLTDVILDWWKDV